MLELALTPYDLLRLRRATGLSSTRILHEYVIEEQDVAEPFPRFYLTMVDDGRASCVFVGPSGCTVYPHRPSACRTYPLGRASVCGERGEIEEHFVLLKERHCKGFAEPNVQTIDSYSIDQDLEIFNRMNDRVARILQHKSIRQGVIPSKSQIDFFRLALYDLDAFRDSLLAGEFADLWNEQDVLEDMEDEQLFERALTMVEKVLFGPVTLTSGGRV